MCAIRTLKGLEMDTENNNDARKYRKGKPRKRADAFDETTQRRFLAFLSSNGNVTMSAERAGISRSVVYKFFRTDEKFSKRMYDARQEAADRLEEEARRRGVDGWEEPVFYKGDVCGSVRKYSDSLLLALLKANKPEKFRERSDVSGSLAVDQNLTFADIVRIETEKRQKREKGNGSDQEEFNETF